MHLPIMPGNKPRMKGRMYMGELWNQYYSEYIQEHKTDGTDVYELTNGAIHYCMQKLGLHMPVQGKES